MNFFRPTGTLDVAGAKLEPSKVELTETKSIHSSEDELEVKEVVTVAPKRQRGKGLANRKHNKDFKSVWYDDEVEDVQEEPLKQYPLKKATSLDNLLDSGLGRFRSRNLLTKKMISSPISSRKIKGDWTYDREMEKNSVGLECLRRKYSGPLETASVAVDYFTKMAQDGKSGSNDSLKPSETKEEAPAPKDSMEKPEETKVELVVSPPVVCSETTLKEQTVSPPNIVVTEAKQDTKPKETTTEIEPSPFSLEGTGSTKENEDQAQVKSTIRPDIATKALGENLEVEEVNEILRSVEQSSIIATTGSNVEEEQGKTTKIETVPQPDNTISNSESVNTVTDAKGMFDGPQTIVLRKSSDATPKTRPSRSLELKTFRLTPPSDAQLKTFSLTPPPDVPLKTFRLRSPSDVQLKTPPPPVETQLKTFGQTPPTNVQLKTCAQTPPLDAQLKTCGQAPPTDVQLKTVGQTLSTDVQLKTCGQTPSIDAQLKTCGQTPLAGSQLKTYGQSPATDAEQLKTFSQTPSSEVVQLKTFNRTPPTNVVQMTTFGQTHVTDVVQLKTFNQAPAVDVAQLKTTIQPSIDVVQSKTFNRTASIELAKTTSAQAPSTEPLQLKTFPQSSSTDVVNVKTFSQTPTDVVKAETCGQAPSTNPLELKTFHQTPSTDEIKAKTFSQAPSNVIKAKPSTDDLELKTFTQTPSTDVVKAKTFGQAPAGATLGQKIVETVFSGGKDFYYKKHGSLEGKSRFKKVEKIDISAPILPKMNLEGGNEVFLSNLNTEDVTNLLRQKSKSTNDLLKSFNQIKNEKSEQLNNPKFPISEKDEVDDEVQVRRNQSINAYRCSKTTDFDFGRKWTSNTKDFEVKGLTKMFISSETTPIKLRRTDTLKYQNGSFYKVDDSSKKLLKSNVTLKSAKLLNKKDVDLRDANNLSYILFFESSKEAKLFVESDRIRCYNENDNKSTITKTLLRLLGKRSSRELLERKGIYQNEPIFGNTLRNIYNTEKGVPRFIIRTMELIERPENITSLGIYRTSGNLATIQKIRFEVDKGRLGILNEYCKDVDVLTGCLKLFFRELKEPLIPCDVCDSLLSVTKSDRKYSKKDREHIRHIINKLPEANSETLYMLIKHLIEVVKYKEDNKMDTYNLSVCWGPTIIFMADAMLTKDPMAQTADAARAFDALLTFYIDHPEELDFDRKFHDHLDSNRNPIQREDSKESIRSIDSNTSRTQKKSGSNSSLNVDEVLKKSVELIEANINIEGLYKRSGSSEKVNKIVKKMMKKKVGELERHKIDPNDLTDSLKKYLKDFPEALVTQECVEQVNKFCDNSPCLEPNNRQRIISVVESLPKKDTFVYLVRHVIRVMRHEHQHNVSRTDMISIWTYVLNYQNKVVDSNEKFSSFLKAVLDVFDESKPDAMPSPKSFSNGLLNDLRNYQKDKDRVSKYDNVPEHDNVTMREATILEEKTEEAEYTKL